MAALKRQKGIVWIPRHSVHFPMRAAGGDVVCVQTLAGFRKVFGLKKVSQDKMRKIFWDYREDFEALASLLYEADAGYAMIITIQPATSRAEAGNRG
jgi:Protein of unknown function (DUF1488)